MAILTVRKTLITIGSVEIDAYTADEQRPDGSYVNYLSGHGLADTLDLPNNSTIHNRMSQELKATLGSDFRFIEAQYQMESGGLTKLKLWTLEDANKFWLYHLHQGNVRAALLFALEQKPSKAEETKGFVYLIRNESTGNLKIGFSTNPCKRLSSLQTASDGELKLLAFVPGTLEDESSLHLKFSFAHIRNEWFKPVPEIYLKFGLVKESIEI